MSTVVELSLKHERDFFIFPTHAVEGIPEGEDAEPLSIDNMGPIRVDLDLLSVQERNAVLFNVACGRLISETQLDLSDPQAETQEVPVTAASAPVKKVDPLKKKMARQKKIIPVLRGKVSEVKARMREIDSSKDLAILRDAERRGKARKTVLAVIEARMQELAARVAHAIETGPSMAPPRSEVGMSRINDIVEEEYEEITVTFGPKDE